MHLAIVNNITKKVENVIVPPQGAQVYFVAEGYTAIETISGAIGDTWEGEAFSRPDTSQPVEPEEP